MMTPKRAWFRRSVGWVVLAASTGCGAFNPAFVQLLSSTTGAQLATLDPAPGHVVLQFVNNAEVDERLVAYLESTGGLALTNAEKRALRPRVRMRVLVTFANGVQLPFEMIDGSSLLIDQRFAGIASPDLNQNDLNNAVVLCNVSGVQLDTSTPIEVFIPVELRSYQLVQISTGGNDVRSEFQLREQIPPQFRALRQDQLDENGNVVLQSNVGVRDFPAPVVNPVCGSVIAIVMNGTLSVPFLAGVDDNPSFDQDSAAVVAGIGGRYEFVVSVQ